MKTAVRLSAATALVMLLCTSAFAKVYPLENKMRITLPEGWVLLKNGSSGKVADAKLFAKVFYQTDAQQAAATAFFAACDPKGSMGVIVQGKPAKEGADGFTEKSDAEFAPIAAEVAGAIKERMTEAGKIAVRPFVCESVSVIRGLCAKGNISFMRGEILLVPDKGKKDMLHFYILARKGTGMVMQSMGPAAGAEQKILEEIALSLTRE